MAKEDFIIYCLLYAIDAANIKKQNLVQMALKTDAVSFVRVYNRYALHDDATKSNEIENGKREYIKSYDDLTLFLNEMKTTFLDEEGPDFGELIFDNLRAILK